MLQTGFTLHEQDVTNGVVVGAWLERFSQQDRGEGLGGGARFFGNLLLDSVACKLES